MNHFTQRKEFGEECYDLIYVLTSKPRAVCRGLPAETGRPARRLLTQSLWAGGDGGSNRLVAMEQGEEVGFKYIMKGFPKGMMGEMREIKEAKGFR